MLFLLFADGITNKIVVLFFIVSWEQRKFAEFAQRESTFRMSSPDYPSVEYEDVVAEEGRLNKDIRKKETQKTGIEFDGIQVLYGKLRPYLHNWLNPDFKGVAVGDWWVLRPIGIEKSFLFRLIQTKQFDEIANQSSGSKMPRADWNLVSNTEFIIPPSMDEQRQIAETFDNLDNLITLHQRKENLLFMKFFPCKTLSLTSISWEQRKLGDVAKIVGGGTPNTLIEAYWDGDINWYAPAEIADQIYLDESKRKITQQGFDNCSAKMLPVGTVLFTSRAGIGKTAILRKKACTNQGFQSIVPNCNELDSYFIYSRSDELKEYGETVGAGSTFVEVSGKQMENMDLQIPKRIAEQRIIGAFFARLDDLITLHQRINY